MNEMDGCKGCFKDYYDGWMDLMAVLRITMDGCNVKTNKKTNGPFVS